jgi:PAS domain S-box-containing protein
MGDQAKPYRQLELELAGANARIAALEMELAASCDRADSRDFGKILDLAPIPIWIAHDPHCRVITGNRAASELSRIDAHANVSQTPPAGQEVPRVRHLRDGRDLRPEELPLQYAVAHGKELRDIELDLVLPDGTVKSVTGSASPLFDSDGHIHGGIVAYLDLTPRKRVEEALRDSERRYRRLFEDASLGIFQSTAEGQYIQVNPAFARMFGYDSPEQVKALVTDIGSQTYACPERRADVVRMIMESRAPVVVENLCKRRDGSTFVGSLHAWGVYDEQGRFSRLEGFIEDITDRKRAEDALRASEEKYRALIETTDTGYVVLDTEGRVLDANLEYARLAGYKTAADVLGRKVSEWTAPDNHPRSAEAIRKCLADGVVHNVPLDHVMKDGRIIPIEGHASVLRTASGTRILALCRDVADRKRAEEALHALNETLEQRVTERTALAESRALQLRDLAVQVIRAEEQERRRVASILHDHLQQLLVAAKLRVGLLRRHPERPAAEPLEQIEASLAETIRVSRSLTVELCPPILYDGGLAQALQWLARWVQDRQGLQVNVSGDLPAKPIEQDLQVLLFHAVRELLFNVVKHAGQSVAAVEMTLQDGHLCIAVTDNGVGFDLSLLLSQQNDPAGYGLFSIRERLERLGGRLEIDTAPGCGARVSLIVPVGSTARDVPANRRKGRHPRR